MYEEVKNDWDKISTDNNNSNCNYKLIKEQELADGHKPGTSNAYLGNEKDDALEEWKSVCGKGVGHNGKYYLNGYYKSYDKISSLDFLNCRSKKIFNNIDGIDKENTTNYIEYLNKNIDFLFNYYNKNTDNNKTNDNINKYLTEKNKIKNKRIALLIDDLKKKKLLIII